MQVSNIVSQVSSDLALEVVVGKVEEVSACVQLTELQVVGGGTGCYAW